MLFRSFDNGDSWDSLHAGRGLPLAQVRSLFVDATDRLYLGTGGKGVVRSDNAGGSWDTLNGDFGTPSISSFAVDSSGYMYVGTANGNIHKSRASIYTVNSVPPQLKNIASLRVVPNPAREAAVLQVLVSTPLRFHVSLHDALGRRVRQLPEQHFVAGEHRIALDSATLPPGLYFVRVAGPHESSTRAFVIR